MLDSSVLVGTVRGEPDVVGLLDLLNSEDCAIGAPTLVETRAWCAVNLAAHSSPWLEDFIEAGPGVIIPFSREMADSASRAFNRLGRARGHPASLNFGDCMAYAVSAILQAPLLFKGNDFGLTDVLVDPASIRL